MHIIHKLNLSNSFVRNLTEVLKSVEPDPSFPSQTGFQQVPISLLHQDRGESLSVFLFCSTIQSANQKEIVNISSSVNAPSFGPSSQDYFVK